MDTAVLEEIRACLPEGRTFFPYFKDRYALMLLGYAARDVRSVSDLKRGRLSPLLQRPAVKEVLARRGDGRVSADDFQCHWPRDHEQFLLTLGHWGCSAHSRLADSAWWQTSRPGWNLVLQLNFSSAYEDTKACFLKAGHEDLHVNTSLHPVRIRGRDRFFRETLAWARIDLDLDTGEALIEEVQSDWIRWVEASVEHWLENRMESLDAKASSAHTAPEQRARAYLQQVLPRYRAIWQEAMLASAIWFIREELGLPEIFYHTHLGGMVAKQLPEHAGPPRSLYTQLPRRFCFERTGVGPEFLYREPRLRRRGCYRRGERLCPRRQRLEGLEWHRLSV